MPAGYGAEKVAIPRFTSPGVLALLWRVSRRCPNCGDSLERIPRRLIDRLAGLWHPVHRYQCRNPLCYWQGNLGVVDPPWGGLEPMVVALGVRLKRSGSALLRHPRSAAVIDRAWSWLRRR